MKEKNIKIPVTKEESVSGVLSIPEETNSKRMAGIIIAHGAGNDMQNPLIVKVATGLAEAGHMALRFNFLYREKGKKAPDRQAILVKTWESAWRFFIKEQDFKDRPVVAAGKSMGGRIASQMISEGKLPVQGLVLLGYPLHASGKKDKLRDAHLYHMEIPMLFFAGTRDSLCDINLLNGVLKRLKAPWQLQTIEGGDHSFRLPKSADIDQEQIYRSILNDFSQWVDKLFTAP